MAEAIIRGIINAGLVNPDSLFINDISEERTKYIAKKYGVTVIKEYSRLLKKTSVLIIAVKPQQMGDVLGNISVGISPRHLVISIAAGIKTVFIENKLCNRPRVVRVMPNTPAMVCLGATVVCKGKKAKHSDIKTVLNIFNSMGYSAELPERLMNAVTAVSGSGPAYVFYLAEGMTEAAVKLGIPKDIAVQLVVNTIHGAGKMLAWKEALPATLLRKKVTSPGGTTEAAIKYLESKDWLTRFINAVTAAEKRAKVLGSK